MKNTTRSRYYQDGTRVQFFNNGVSRTGVVSGYANYGTDYYVLSDDSKYQKRYGMKEADMIALSYPTQMHDMADELLTL